MTWIDNKKSWTELSFDQFSKETRYRNGWKKIVRRPPLILLGFVTVEDMALFGIWVARHVFVVAGIDSCFWNHSTGEIEHLI